MFAAVAAVLLAPPSSPVQLLLTHTPEDTKTPRAAVHVAVSSDGKWLATSEVTRDDKAQEWVKQLRLRELKTGNVVETRADRAEILSLPVFLAPDKLAVQYSTHLGMDRWARGTVLLSVPELKPLDRFENRFVSAPSPDGTTVLCRTGGRFELWDWKAKKTRSANVTGRAGFPGH